MVLATIIVKTLMLTFFHKYISPLDTDYISPSDFNGNFEDFSENLFSIFNIRSLNKSLESFAELFI